MDEKKMPNIYFGGVSGNCSRSQLHNAMSEGEIVDKPPVFLNYPFRHCIQHSIFKLKRMIAKTFPRNCTLGKGVIFSTHALHAFHEMLKVTSPYVPSVERLSESVFMIQWIVPQDYSVNACGLWLLKMNCSSARTEKD